MPPTASAFFVRRLRNQRHRFFPRFDFQIAQDEEFLDLLVRNFGNGAWFAAQNDSRFERVADQLFLARALDRLTDHAAQGQELRYTIARHRVSKFAVRLRENFEMY